MHDQISQLFILNHLLWSQKLGTFGVKRLHLVFFKLSQIDDTRVIAVNRLTMGNDILVLPKLILFVMLKRLASIFLSLEAD